MTTSLHRHLRLLGVLVSVAIATAPAAPASAASRPSAGFSIQPTGHNETFEFPGRPGSHVRGSVRVINASSRTKTIRLAAADVGTFPAGGVMYGEAAQRTAGTWVHLDKRAVAIPGRGSTNVGFVARIPIRARGGFHYAGIVATDGAARRSPRAKPKNGRSEIRVRQVVRFALPIRLRLPGPLSTRLALSDVDTRIDATGLALILRLKNAGNTLIRKTVVDLMVSGDSGPVLRYRGNLGPFVPDSAIASSIRWGKPPAEGEYRVVGTLRPSGGPAVRIDRTITFSTQEGRSLKKESGQELHPSTSTPVVLWLILGFACLLALGSFGGYCRMRRRLGKAAARA
jgi:hypothetical protein